MKDSKLIKKLESICPSLVDKGYTNPFLYRDVEKWYKKLKAKQLKKQRFEDDFHG